MEQNQQLTTDRTDNRQPTTDKFDSKVAAVHLVLQHECERRPGPAGPDPLPKTQAPAPSIPSAASPETLVWTS